MTDAAHRIEAITLDDANLPEPTAEIAGEREVAVDDLLEGNRFALTRDGAPDGPYALALAIRERRLVMTLTGGGGEAGEIILSLGPFRQVVKDYWQICEAYFDAVKKLPPSQIEAIDMARRGIHNEGARLLQERLEGKAEMDGDTARRLFTLICVLHHGG